MITVQAVHYVDHDFSGEDLQDHHFINCHFYRCNFNHSDLSDSQFEACQFLESGDLIGCDFSYATLTSCQFNQCNLSLSQFKGSHCFGAEFNASNLKGADFHRASFTNYITQKSYFCSGKITESNLAYANLDGVLLEECELTDNRWLGANLNGASMRGADLSGGEFSPEQWGCFDLRGANLTRVELHGLDPRTVSLDGVIISGWQQSQLLAPLGLIIQAD
ncbi:Qnr family pentapeptide repeat protein [Shewanella sp. Isolate11]|uniref:Qnr family pentapeptide repeat protein n=1 Tax=Shewanella sp. Isolate11 TaxID=2908530 RepID=UPI001EFD1BB7|nr:Qnr family pentapeptide repeat protein [Shewanella sp. Isolate11]MCG9695546.1 Qnr family pentapeptide repeat protein [Shewanella sp. Isolate11]